MADSSWWKALQADSVLLTVGSDECMRDVVIRLGKNMQVSRCSLAAFRTKGTTSVYMGTDTRSTELITKSTSSHWYK